MAAMSERWVYYLARKAEFERAREDGFYLGSAEDRADGFIHFSTASQVRASAAKHRRGERDLLLLEVDAEGLGAELRWEAARGGQLFPHLYGRLPLAAVTRAAPLPLEAGAHEFPDWV
jgi:uncharacterized protein (DUF952 family)